MNTKVNDHAADVQEDPRVMRSTRALREAMANLLAEQRFGSITVQQILERAGVSRATFYKYYRDKDDALFSSYEGMFRTLESHLEATQDRHARRVAPVCELLAHLDSSRAVIASLQGSDRMEQIWDLGAGFMADIIARRLTGPSIPTGTVQQVADDVMQRQLMSRMLSGAAIEMIKWWVDRPVRSGASERPSPASMDIHFHVMARRAVQPFGYSW